MADYTNRVPENVGNYFFVDSECIACDTCEKIAPTHFKLTSNNNSAFVCHQPTTSTQIQQCNTALKTCPVDAIGIYNDANR